MLRKVKESILKTGWSWGLYTPPDRATLVVLLRRFAERADIKRVLFVGVKAYNRELPAIFAPRVFATIDPTPEVAAFGGAPHWVDVLENLEAHTGPSSFDLVVMNGVIGFGLNEPTNVERALRQVHRALSPGGTLLLGINEEIATHVDLARVEAMKHFVARDLPGFGAPRLVLPTPFREKTHTFACFERSPGDADGGQHASASEPVR